MIGLFQEHGPCRISNDSTTLNYNPYSWNNYTNMCALSPILLLRRVLPIASPIADCFHSFHLHRPVESTLINLSGSDTLTEQKARPALALPPLQSINSSKSSSTIPHSRRMRLTSLRCGRRVMEVIMDLLSPSELGRLSIMNEMTCTDVSI